MFDINFDSNYYRASLTSPQKILRYRNYSYGVLIYYGMVAIIIIVVVTFHINFD